MGYAFFCFLLTPGSTEERALFHGQCRVLDLLHSSRIACFLSISSHLIWLQGLQPWLGRVVHRTDLMRLYLVQ